MVVIREYANEIEAQIARSVLESNDIPAVVLTDSAGGMLPSLQLIIPVRLAVRESDADRAIQMLDEDFEDDETEI